MRGVRDRWRRVVRRRAGRGAAALEFGLIMPILLLLVFGIIQYGLYFWAMQGGSDFARDFSRRAAVGDHSVNTCTSFKSVVQGDIDGFAAAEKAKLIRRQYIQDTSLTRTNATDIVVGDRVQVTVQFKSHDLNLPFIPFIDDGLVTSTAEARVEYVDPTGQPGLLCEKVIP